MPDNIVEDIANQVMKEPQLNTETESKPRKWFLRYADGTKFKARNVSMERPWGGDSSVHITFHVKVRQSYRLPTFGEQLSCRLVTEGLCLQFEDAEVGTITRLAAGGKKNRWYQVGICLDL